MRLAEWEPWCEMAGPQGERTTGLATLRRRAEFLRVRGGARWATPAFVLEAKQRGGEAEGARFGFTVSKQVGGAVERNRIRRRLKAAVRDVLADRARPDFDYVLIARRPALDTAFASLVADLVHALERVNAPRTQRRHTASRK
jgi:ribonuclease P protein component